MRNFIFLFGLILSCGFGQVTITPYSAEKFPDLTNQIKPYMKGFEHLAMVMTNNLDKDITATTIVWSYKSNQYNGVPRGINASFDNYNLPAQSFHPVVAAHSSTLLAPNESGFRRFPDAVDGKVQIELDSIVFADGEIQGPNLLDAATAITSRYDAAQKIAGRLHTAKLSHKSTADVAQEIGRDIVPGHQGGQWNWMQQYQARLANMADNPVMVAAFLHSLDGMVQPPKFYKLAK